MHFFLIFFRIQNVNTLGSFKELFSGPESSVGYRGATKTWVRARTKASLLHSRKKEKTTKRVWPKCLLTKIQSQKWESAKNYWVLKTLGNRTGGKPSVLKSIAFFKTFLGSGATNVVFIFIT